MKLQITINLLYLTVLIGNSVLLILADHLTDARLSLKHANETNNSEEVTKIASSQRGLNNVDQNGIKLENLYDFIKTGALLRVGENILSKSNLSHSRIQDYYLLEPHFHYVDSDLEGSNPLKDTDIINIRKKHNFTLYDLIKLNENKSPGLVTENLSFARRNNEERNISNSEKFHYLFAPVTSNLKHNSEPKSKISLNQPSVLIKLPQSGGSTNVYNVTSLKTKNNRQSQAFPNKLLEMQNIISNKTMKPAIEFLLITSPNNNSNIKATSSNYPKNAVGKINLKFKQNEIPIYLIFRNNSKISSQNVKSTVDNVTTERPEMFERSGRQFNIFSQVLPLKSNSTVFLPDYTLKVFPENNASSTADNFITSKDQMNGEKSIITEDTGNVMADQNYDKEPESMISSFSSGINNNAPSTSIISESVKTYNNVVENIDNAQQFSDSFKNNEKSKIHIIELDELANNSSSSQSEKHISEKALMISQDPLITNDVLRTQTRKSDANRPASIVIGMNKKLKLIPDLLMDNNRASLSRGNEEIAFSRSYKFFDNNKEISRPQALREEFNYPSVVKGVLISSSDMLNSENKDEELTLPIVLYDQDSMSEIPETRISLPDFSVTGTNTVANSENEKMMLVDPSQNFSDLKKESFGISEMESEASEEGNEKSPTIVKGILKSSFDILNSGNLNEDSRVGASQDSEFKGGIPDQDVNAQETLGEITGSEISIVKEEDENIKYNVNSQNDASYDNNDGSGVFPLDDQIQSGKIYDRTDQAEGYTFIENTMLSNNNNNIVNTGVVKNNMNDDFISSSDDTLSVHNEFAVKTENLLPSSISIFQTDNSKGVITQESENIPEEESDDILDEYLIKDLPPGMHVVYNKEKAMPEIVLSDNFLTSKDTLLITTSDGHHIIIREDSDKEHTETGNIETSEVEPVENFYDHDSRWSEGEEYFQIDDSSVPHEHTRDSEIYRNKGPLWWVHTKDGFVPSGGIQATKGFVFKLKETGGTPSNQEQEVEEVSFS